MGWNDFCLICDAYRWRCSFIGSVCVSSCRCCAPSCFLGTVFYVIYSLLMFVSDASGDHMVKTYSSMYLVMALYIARIVFLCFPHVVDVSALSICIVMRAFVVVISMCLWYVSLGWRVSPSIFWLMFMGSVMLSIFSSSCVLYSAESGVRRVHVVLSGMRMRLFVWIENEIVCLCPCMYFL